MSSVRRNGRALRIGVAMAALIGAPVRAQQPTVVRPTEPPAWGESLRLVEEVRIGKLDGADEYLFGRIVGVAIGRDGTIHVADGQVPIIRSYDAQGRFLRNVGRRGQGPGEYANIGGIATLRDGRLAVWDNRNGRITLYTTAGEFADSYRVPSGLFASDIFQVDATGHFYVRASYPRRQDSGERQQGWIRVAPTGRILDTIPIPVDPGEGTSFVLSTPSGYDRPFNKELVTTLSTLGYLISGWNDTYGFELKRPNGALRIERVHQPIPVTRDERKEWEAWAEFFRRRAMEQSASSPPVRAPGAERRNYSIPEVKPAYSDLRTDSQGRIWVRRYVTSVSKPGAERPAGDQRPRRVWREPPTFDVFEPTGRFLGTVTLPWNASFHDSIDRQIWATVRGESDEAYVVRFRLEPAPR